MNYTADALQANVSSVSEAYSDANATVAFNATSVGRTKAKNISSFTVEPKDSLKTRNSVNTTPKTLSLDHLIPNTTLSKDHETSSATTNLRPSTYTFRKPPKPSEVKMLFNTTVKMLNETPTTQGDLIPGGLPNTSSRQIKSESVTTISPSRTTSKIITESPSTSKPISTASSTKESSSTHKPTTDKSTLSKDLKTSTKISLSTTPYQKTTRSALTTKKITTKQVSPSTSMKPVTSTLTSSSTKTTKPVTFPRTDVNNFKRNKVSKVSPTKFTVVTEAISTKRKFSSKRFNDAFIGNGISPLPPRSQSTIASSEPAQSMGAAPLVIVVLLPFLALFLIAIITAIRRKMKKTRRRGNRYQKKDTEVRIDGNESQMIPLNNAEVHD